MSSILTMFVLAVISTSWAGANSNTAQGIYKNNFEAIVLIENEIGSKGTGFLISSNQVVTNKHVALGSVRDHRKALPYKIHTAFSSEITSFSSVLCSTRVDLCIIGLKEDVSLKSFPLMGARKINPGEDLIILGHPLGFDSPVISTGIASSQFQKMFNPDSTIDNKHFIGFTTTSPISKGSSGSPVFSKDGKVQGVVVSYYDGAQNLNNVISILEVHSLISAFIHKEFDEYILLTVDIVKEGREILKKIKMRSKVVPAKPAL